MCHPVLYQPKSFYSEPLRLGLSLTCIYGLPDRPEPLRVVVVVEEEPAAEVLVGRPLCGRVAQSIVPTQKLTVNYKIRYKT